MMAAAAACLLLAATPDTRLLATLDAERNSLKALSFTAEIRTPKPGGRSSRFTMTFSFAAPNRYRAEIKMGIEGTLLTVCDGEWIWSYESRTRKCFRQRRESADRRLDAAGPLDPVSALATPGVPIARLFALDSTLVSAGAVTFDLRPKRAVPNYDRLILTTTRDARTPVSAATFLRGRPVATIAFRNMKKNLPPPDSLFRFTPPKGVAVVEMR